MREFRQQTSDAHVVLDGVIFFDSVCISTHYLLFIDCITSLSNDMWW